MSGMRKLKAVRAIVRPDKRADYLERWKRYAGSAQAAGAQVRLFEDQALPGRFLEFTEHEVAKGMEARLDGAFREAKLRQVCLRREGDEVLYREAAVDG